ncbi:MAG: class I SAM-dependent DNA methyltransferase [Bacteroidia bacterium]|nr:class I SAM-dependent DNA methyltransferase [Bacteroidia bacterium]
MSLSWNEIKERASRFSKEWDNAFNEEAEAKTFLYEFFNVFGISQRKVATFEHKVKKLDAHDGYIDLLWKGNLLIEMKSKGKNLDKALTQAKDYIQGLPQHEIPKYILVSDFDVFRLIDIEEEKTTEFKLKELVKNIHLFGFIAGYQKRTYKEEDPVNIDAAMLMGKLHDRLKAIGYSGHSLERYLVRLLFCLFADDTSIFEKGIFQDYIEQKTKEDGSDLAYHIAAIFNTLNLPKENRLTNIDENLAAFPYVNGKLFEETLPFASFDSGMRQTLLECCYLDWSKISPAIFGSLFQSVMDEKARRNLGAHYTSEKNILKLIKPLFLDGLWKEFNSAKGNVRELKKLQLKISTLRFLDPACGCGNFLIIAYRELRLLEMEIVKSILGSQQVTDIGTYFLVDVDKFYGIEYEEFPSLIAQVAMWLIDHQMNMQASVLFGEYFVRLPLKKSATIKNGNALQIDWQSLIEPLSWEKEEPKYHFILGNPPFIGKHLQNESQKKDLELIFAGVNGSGVLDYVTAWYIKAAQYLKTYNSEKKEIKCAFVSTNSIVQGEQVGVLWNEMFNKYQIKIHFAHRTFRWNNEAKGNAAVHVVIVGFSNFDTSEKLIYEYEDIKGEPHELRAKNINPYLVEGKDFFIGSRKKAICNVPEMVKGSQPTDGGNLLLSNEEKETLIKTSMHAEKYIFRFVSAKEFLHNEQRWCLWLVDIKPDEIKKIPEILHRIDEVRKMRLLSTKQATIKWADFPTLFTENRQPTSDYILIPRHSSENRKYIPFGFFDKTFIVADSCNSIPNANTYHFGIVSSLMHMTWIKHVCGRIKSDLRYSNDIVYNNYPWPENPTEKQIAQIEKAAQKVLDERLEFPESSLADLYDPLTMPPALVKAHQELDKAVDLCYRAQPFINETKRIEFLFELYDRYTSGLFVIEKGVKKTKDNKGIF